MNGTSVASKKVHARYDEMIKKLGSEFSILLEVPIKKISEDVGSDIADAIASVRLNNVKLTPGFDGVFGKIDVIKKVSVAQQKLL